VFVRHWLACSRVTRCQVGDAGKEVNDDALLLSNGVGEALSRDWDMYCFFGGVEFANNNQVGVICRV